MNNKIRFITLSFEPKSSNTDLTENIFKTKTLLFALNGLLLI